MNKELSIELEESVESTGKYELKSVYVVEDLFDINLNGNLESEIIGVFNSLEEAIVVIDAQRWANIKWIGDRKFKYTGSDDSIHIGFINKYPVGVIL